ncbi:MAG: hypothetical protein KGZ53_00170 [Peptococcaceae bacterium]|nr:hypothetical protein [Peptococcaceae bacterium]
MDCRKYRVLIEVHLESGLPKVPLLELEHHLNVCLCCRRYRDELSRLEEALQDCPQVRAPHGFTEALLKKLPKNYAKAMPRYSYLSPRIRVVGAVAALVLLLGSPLYILVESPRPIVESSDLNAQFTIIDSTIIVPEGAIISGDIRVYHGHLKILGTVDGNVHLVSSGYTLESSGTVAGSVDVVKSSWLERLKFGIDQIRQDAKSYVRGAWK